MTTRFRIHFLAALMLLIPLGAQAAQDGAINDPGDIAFVAYHDNLDGLSFVLLDDAPHNTSIRFVDEEWTGSAFSSPTGEGEVLWTNNTGSTIAKGTVIEITDIGGVGMSPSHGTAIEADSGFGTANGDQVYAITGTRAAPGTFLAFVGESQDLNGAETAVLTGTGLTAGTDAKLIVTEGYYSGSTACNSTVSACLQQINGASWIGTAGFSYPADSPSSFSGALFASDSTPPAVTSITLSGSPASSATSVTFTVGFDESANNISTDDFSVTTVSGSATGSVASVSASSGTSITVTVNSIAGVGSIRLDLKASTNITDDTGNGNGTNGSVATFTTGGTHTVSILDSDASLTASGTVSEPVAIDTTFDTTGEAVNVFDFTLSDGGTSDGSALTVSQIVLNVAGTTSDAQRANVTWRLNGADESNVTGVYNAVADTITFSSLSISVADGASEVYTVNAFYNNNSGLSEGLTYILSVDGDTDLTVGSSGTQMGATSAINNSTGSTVDVVATTLAFTTQPAGSVSGAVLTTQPVITARDAAGNTDTDFSEIITLTEASAGSLSGNTKAASAGVATFTAVNYTATADQQGFTLTADDEGGVGSNLSTVDANAVTSDVVATVLAFTTLPAGSVSGNALTTQPVVTARDANGVIDTGFTETITLSEGSAGTITNNTVAAAAGVATFSGVAYTATLDQQSFTLAADDQAGVGTDLSTTSANPITSDVVATKLVFDTQPAPITVTSGAATSFTTVPVVSAKDANNVVDSGYFMDIVISEINGAGSALMSGTGDTDGDSATVSLTPTAGVATFTGMQATYTSGSASNENFNLAASASGLTIATSSQLTAMLPVPTITSSTYNATTASLVVTGTEFEANASAADVDVSKLTITGEGGATYTLTTAGVERDSATQFTVSLNAADKLNVNGLLNTVGTAADNGTTYNIAAGDDFITNVTAGDTADATSNPISVSDVVVPTITSATFNGNGTILTVTGTGFVKKPGANNDVDVSKITVSGETYTTNSISFVTYTSPYTITSTSDVEVTSATQFTVTLPEAGFSGVLTANGLKASDDATYNVAFADDWMPGAATSSNIEDLTGNSLTVSNAFTYSITASSNVTTNGGSNGSATATAIGGTAGFSYIWSDGQTTATAGSWVAGTYKTLVTDANGLVRSASVTITEPAPDPIITSAAYNGNTGVLTVTGSNFVANSGAANDVDISLLTIIGQAGNTRSLTSSSDVEITNSTTFSVTLSGAEKYAVDLVLNKVGTTADDATTYNLAAAEDWMPGALVASNIADLTSNGIVVSNPVDTIKPIVVSVSSSSGVTSSIVGDYIPVVITFSENVVITGVPQIELETGATDRIVDRVGPFSGISELKFDYQVQAGDTSADLAYKATNSLMLNGGTIKDSAGNDAVLTLPIPGAAGSLSANKNHVVDGIVPTVVISGVPANSNAAFTATFTFSEAVTDFVDTEIIVSNSVRSAFSGSGKVYTAIITPQAEGNVSIAMNPGSVIDAAGNSNALPVSVDSNYDITNPIVTISGVPADSNAAFTATFTFNEAVTGFDAADITLGNATKGAFTATSSTVYTLVVTPTGAAVTVDVAANGAMDVASNGNTAATQVSSAFDNAAPTVNSVSATTADGAYKAGDAVVVTVNFSEAVSVIGTPQLTLETGATDRTINYNGVGSGTTTLQFAYTVQAGDVSADLDYVSTNALIAGTSIKDAAGNDAILTLAAPGAANSLGSLKAIVIDTAVPTLEIGAPSVTTTQDGPVTYSLSYANADNITLVLGNITLNKTGDANGTLALSGTGNTRTVTISGISGDGTLAISIAANSATDNAGNNAAAANSATITVVSNQAGTLSISGNTVVGETLTASLADVDGLTDITVAYQWTSGGNNVGTSAGSYTLQASDVGKTISVNAQYTDQGGTVENINSAATAAIITLQADAVNRISSTANQAGGTEPTVDDYKNAGITDVSDAVLTRILPLINNAIARQSDATDVDDVSKLQALVDVILEGQDNDGDGLPNLVEGTDDTDKDGIADREDTDSDNDGVADQLEVRLTLTDSDSDGIIDVLDADVGNDGQVDTDKVDANFDGVDDALDSMEKLIAKSHANAQATPTAEGEAELPFIQFDQDQDQRPNHLDLDSDNDGVMDVVESGLNDSNGDGKMDAGDTLITDGSQLLDSDADSLPNMLELKSDGISFDLIVNGLSDTLDKDANGILDSTIDMDRDGIMDSVDNAIGAQGTLPDLDGDGIPNHLDDDDDGDGIPDVNENPQQQYFTGLDADADGIDDGVDQNINGVLEGEDLNNNGVRDDRELSDVDNDGIADHLDADSDNDGIPDSEDIVVNVGDDVKSGGTGTMSIMMMMSLLLLSVCRYSRSVLQLSVLLLLWLSATISHAQDWQVNLGLGQSRLSPDLASGLKTSNGNDRAVQLGLGYRISSDWLVELRYADLGDAVIRGNQRHSTLGYQSWVLDTKYQLPLLQGTEWSPYVMGGIAINRLQADDLSLEKKTDSGLMLGAGISYRFQEFQLNSELIRYSDGISGWFMGIQKDF